MSISNGPGYGLCFYIHVQVLINDTLIVKFQNKWEIMPPNTNIQTTWYGLKGFNDIQVQINDSFIVKFQNKAGRLCHPIQMKY